MLNREEPENPITSNKEYEFNDLIEEITINEPTPGEVKEAIKRLKNGKAPGIDYHSRVTNDEHRVLSNEGTSIVEENMET